MEAGSNELVMLVKRRLNRISSAQVMIKRSPTRARTYSVANKPLMGPGLNCLFN